VKTEHNHTGDQVDTDRSPTICLCMIVRNEEHVIARALRSVMGLIDYWVICDTGSTDATAGKILQTMGSIPGEMHRIKWENFGQARTEAIRRARGKADYILLIDADMIVNVKEPFKHLLTDDVYDIRYEGDVDYSQPMLVANRHDWRFVGATHEYIFSETAGHLIPLPQLTLSHIGDGGYREEKYQRDILILEAALKDDPQNTRSMFYLAQSYRDLKCHVKALHWYDRRGEEDGWEEERWYAMYQGARMRELLGHPWEEVLAAYLAAYEFRPARLEPLYKVVRHYADAGQYELGHLYAAASLDRKYPAQDRLFIERSVYQHKFALEIGLCTLGVGQRAKAIRAFNQVCWAKPSMSELDSAVRGRSLALGCADVKGTRDGVRRNGFTIIVPFHNPGHFLDNCVESVLSQDYDRFNVVFVDDQSTDGSAKVIPFEDSRVRVTTNATRRYVTRNVHDVVCEMDEDEIIVVIDGDDWLSDCDALSWIDSIYNQQDCWLTFGQYRFSDGRYGWAAPFADASEFAQHRSLPWRASHLRTFRAGLYHRLADQDATYACMRGRDGNWWRSAADVALMMPLLDMAGFERAHFCDRCIYVYNIENPSSWFKTDRAVQAQNYDEIAALRPFAQINSYKASCMEMRT